MLATGLVLHAFGPRYDLPAALALYLFAAGGVVVISFVMVVVFAGEKLGAEAVRYPRWPAPWLAAAGRSPLIRIISGAAGVLVLLAIVITGLFGSANPAVNPAEYLTWIYFWAGLVILSGLLGNVWTLVNPWTALYDLGNRYLRLSPRRQLPDRLGIWPAVAVYVCFACLELTSGLAGRPWLIAVLAIAYSVFNLAGMAVFGRDRWLNRVEAFSVLFGIVSRFGPVETERDGEGRIKTAWLRPPGAGLLERQVPGWDWVVFIILMLSSLAFDGLLATPSWQRFVIDLEPWWLPLQPFGFFAVKTFGLVLLTVCFLLVFVAFMRMVMVLGVAEGNPLEAVTAFALTLVPIALVYNAAHNYSYLVVQSQVLIPLLADPLGRGWHLVPTGGYKPSFLLASAAVVWYTQVVLIVAGHVIAVYLAHLRAGERFQSAGRVLLSQYPMLLLMVLYTMTSLWILAQPITREA